MRSVPLSGWPATGNFRQLRLEAGPERRAVSLSKVWSGLDLTANRTILINLTGLLDLIRSVIVGLFRSRTSVAVSLSTCSSGSGYGTEYTKSAPSQDWMCSRTSKCYTIQNVSTSGTGCCRPLTSNGSRKWAPRVSRIIGLFFDPRRRVLGKRQITQRRAFSRQRPLDLMNPYKCT